MNTTLLRTGGVGLAFVLIFLSGILLSMGGKPYGTGLFTIHKLAGLGAGVLLAVIVHRAHQAAPLGAVAIAAIVVTVLLFIGTVAAGGFLSVSEDAPAIVRKLHQVIPALTVLSTAGMLYLLLSGK